MPADLSESAVIATALRLVDSAGLAGCTVRALAGELGVTPMAIYWHVAGKEALFDAVLGAVLAEIATDDLPADPFDALAVGARRYREAFVRHPNAAPLLAERPTPQTPAALAIMVQTIEALRAAGLDETAAMCGYLLLAQFVMGSVLTEHRAGTDTEIAGHPVPAAADRFEFGLGCLISGLRAQA